MIALTESRCYGLRNTVSHNVETAVFSPRKPDLVEQFTLR